MRSSKSCDLAPLDQELERTLRRLKEKKTTLIKQQAAMAEVVEEAENNRALRDYVVPSVNGTTSSIRRPAIQAHNFESSRL